MRVLLVAGVLIASCVPNAHAGWRIDRATAIAEIVWKRPCGGNVTLRWQHLPDRRAGASTDLSTCTVTFDATPFFNPSWAEFCTRMIHEYGHLADYRDPTNPVDPLHSHDPRSVMYYISYGITAGRDQITGQSVERAAGDARCKARGRPYLERHGVLATTARLHNLHKRAVGQKIPSPLVEL